MPRRERAALTTLAAVAAVLVTACEPAGDGGAATRVPFERAWLAGDLHVHSTGASNDTDDASFPADIARVARARGLAWVVLTDHSNATGSMACEDVEECPNQGPEFPYAEEALAVSGDGFHMVDGNEISPIESLSPPSGPVGHVGCIPPDDGFSFVGSFTDRPPGAVDGASAVGQCRDAGGWAVVNHPFAPATWITYDWTTTDFDGLEVWNGGARWDAWDRRGLWAWECLVSTGRPVVPVAGSDVHRVQTEPPGRLLPPNPPLGQPRTSVAVDAPGGGWAAIGAGLRAGRVVLHEEGTFVEGWAEAEGEEWRVRGRAPVPSQVELRSIAPGAVGSCDPAGLEAPLHEVAWTAPVEGDFDLPTEVPARAGELVYLALTRPDLLDIGEGDVALTGLLSVGW